MRSRWVVCMVAVGIMGFAASAIPGEDKGESGEWKALRERATAPKPADLDDAVTLDALLAKPTATSWSNRKAAKVSGYVVQAEKEEDGDIHLVLAAVRGEPDTRKWVIIELTPTWQKRSATLGWKRVIGLRGKKVEATGWLFFEPDTDSADPRGTRWEIHPVTKLSVARR